MALKFALKVIMTALRRYWSLNEAFRDYNARSLNKSQVVYYDIFAVIEDSKAPRSTRGQGGEDPTCFACCAACLEVHAVDQHHAHAPVFVHNAAPQNDSVCGCFLRMHRLVAADFAANVYLSDPLNREGGLGQIELVVFGKEALLPPGPEVLQRGDILRIHCAQPQYKPNNGRPQLCLRLNPKGEKPPGK